MSWNFDTPLLGVDVSGGNNKNRLDPAALRIHRIDFVIAKATEGVTFKDRMYWTHCQSARDGGLVVGTYHFLSPDSDARAQAREFINFAHPEPDTILAVDVETNRARRDPSFDQVTAFVDEFHRLLPGRPLLLYTGKWFWSGHLGDPDASALDVYLWESRWVTKEADSPAAPETLLGRVTGEQGPTLGGWTLDTRPIVQFTDRALVGGQSVQANVFYGNRSQLLATLVASGGATTSL